MKTTDAATFIAAIPDTGVGRYVRLHADELFGAGVISFAAGDGPGADVMPKMVNDLAYDLCDMSPSSLLIARERGIPIRALPVTTFCGFPYAELQVRADAGIDAPAQLAGKTIGVRTWTNPMKPWLFGMLAETEGVDWRESTWVATVADPLPGVELPPNARRSTSDTLATQLREGIVHAAISPGKVGDRGVIPLFPDPLEAAARWYERTGVLPVLHLLAIQEATLERAPWFADAVVRAYAQAKTRYLDHLRSIEPANDALAVDDRRIMERLGIDPVPYGVAANRAAFERFGAYMTDHGYLRAVPAVDDLFVETGALA